MVLSLSQDIRSVTDLKRYTKQVLARAHETGRPVVLTVNGRANAVLLDAASFERYYSAANLAKLLAPAEEDIREGRTRSLRSVLKGKEYRHASQV
jgi:prevent-host-death family protein